MSNILRTDREVLTTQHIRKSLKNFPSPTHAVRKLFAQASIHFWLGYHSWGGNSSFVNFKFKNEVEESEAFASDVLKAVAIDHVFCRLEKLTQPRSCGCALTASAWPGAAPHSSGWGDPQPPVTCTCTWGRAPGW